MTDLTIQTSGYSPDSTYFLTGNVEPDLEDGTLTVYTGSGSSRGWGRPGVTSTVVLESPALVAVHVGFHHKHGGGQFWRYYRPEDGEWRRVSWPKLSDEERQQVLDAADAKAPGWAKAPGKLRAEKKAPYSNRAIRYKIVAVADDGRYMSGFDPDITYELGRARIEQARPSHSGGHYVYDSPARLLARFESQELFPARVYDQFPTFALLEVEVSGRCICYDADGYHTWQTYERNGSFGWEGPFWTAGEPEKEAWTYIKPLHELQRVEMPEAVNVA